MGCIRNLGRDEKMMRQSVRGVQVMSRSMVILPTNELAGKDTGMWEKLALMALQQFGLDEEMTPSNFIGKGGRNIY